MLFSFVGVLLDYGGDAVATVNTIEDGDSTTSPSSLI